MVGYIIFILLGLGIVFGGLFSWFNFRRKVKAGICLERGETFKESLIALILGSLIGSGLMVFMILEWMKDFGV